MATTSDKRIINSRIIVDNSTNNELESSSDISSANKNITVFDDVNKFVAHNITASTNEHSVIFSSNDTKNERWNGQGGNSGMHGAIESSYFHDVYSSVSNNKLQKLSYYRQMVSQAELADAVDEIAESCINENDKGQVVEIEFNRDSFTNLSPNAETEINKHFNSFINLYNFKQNGFYTFREFITDGEATWENIVDKDKLHLGIIDIKKIKPESYEYLIDNYFNHLGILINAQLTKFQKPEDMDKSGTKYAAIDGNNTFGIQKGQVNAITTAMKTSGSMYKATNDEASIIPMPMEQVTHAVSGTYSDDRLTIIPILDRARRAYNQLVILEDASIIYRLVRAPERLVFNIDVGDAAPARANQQVKQLAQQYQSKKVYDTSTGGIANQYDAHQMLESMFFPKTSNGTGGTTVDSIGGSSTNFGSMDDIKYFQQKLFASLKIPYNRFSAENDSEARTNVDSITYAEYRFAKSVIRLQQSMASAIKKTFVTHLKFVGLWDSALLREDAFDISFVVPSMYEYYTTQKMLTEKFKIYNDLSSNADISKSYIMKNVLKWSEADIDQNYADLEKEKIREKTMELKINSISKVVKEYDKARSPSDEESDEEGSENTNSDNFEFDDSFDDDPSEFDDNDFDDLDDNSGADTADTGDLDTAGDIDDIEFDIPDSTPDEL